MTIKTLEYFIVLAESKSINEAAQKLYIAQPGLTKALRSMEEEIGAQLFFRDNTGITLTNVGNQVLADAKRIVKASNHWKELASQNEIQKISIYVHTSFSDFILPEVFLDFCKQYPQIQIEYLNDVYPEKMISKSAKTPTLSMFVCSERDAYEKYTQIQGNPPKVLLRGEYRCMVSTESPLAKYEQITMEDLKDYYLIVPTLEQRKNEQSFLTGFLKSLISVMDRSHLIQVHSLSNVTRLVSRDPETFALGYYPALKRYHEVSQNKLTSIPFKASSVEGLLCLFYSEEVCKQYPLMQDLVKRIEAGAESFLNVNSRKSM